MAKRSIEEQIKDEQSKSAKAVGRLMAREQFGLAAKSLTRKKDEAAVNHATEGLKRLCAALGMACKVHIEAPVQQQLEQADEPV